MNKFKSKLEAKKDSQWTGRQNVKKLPKIQFRKQSYKKDKRGKGGYSEKVLTWTQS